MKIFISWSGERSKLLASALKSWIENFFQHDVNVFMSQSDIEPGTRWALRLNEELEESSYGIICLTPENLNADWILFEAGALSKQVKNSRVIPFLFQVKESDVSGPLSQFQFLHANENGSQRLIEGINNNLEKPLTSEKLKATFNVWWHALQKQIAEMPDKYNKPLPDKRPDRELLEEILQYTRNQTLKENEISKLRDMKESELKKMNASEITAYIQGAIRRMNEGVTPSEIILMKQKIVTAANVLKERFPQMAKVADTLIVEIGLPPKFISSSK